MDVVAAMDGTMPPEMRCRVVTRLRAVREACGLTVEGLSVRSDIAEFIIRAIEDGWTQYTFEQLLCLARALEVPVVEFFGDDK